MPARPRRSIRALLAAAVLGAVTLGSPAVAPAQVDPPTPTTETDPGVTAVNPSSSVVAEPGADDTEPAGTVEPTEVPDSTVPVPVAVDTPFPVALVAPVPPAVGAPDTAITDIYVTDGVDPDAPDVVVAFREPFTFALTQYQLGVVIGDPSGPRLRTWLISNGPDALPYGRVERFEADTWTDLGATTVRFENGLMVITVPITDAPAGGAVWAEINENGDKAPSRTTPYFSRDALFGTGEIGTIPSAIFGRVFGPDGLDREVVPELATGGVLVSIDGEIAVTYDDAPPAEVLGQPVTEAIDIVRIAPDFDDGAVITHFVRLNRTTGEVGLFDGFSPVPIDRTGDRSWLISAPAPGEPGALVIDRAAALAAVGVTDSARVGLGVSREIALDDGRLITAEGVLGTDAWLDLAPVDALPQAATTLAPTAGETGPATNDESRLPLLIGAVVALVVLLLLVVLVRRGRSSRSDGSARTRDSASSAPDAPVALRTDRMPWGSSDGGLITTSTHEFDALIPADATPLPGPAPTAPARAAAPMVPPTGSGVRILANPVPPADAAPLDAEPVWASSEPPASAPDAPRPPVSPPTAGPTTPASTVSEPPPVAPADPEPGGGDGVDLDPGSDLDASVDLAPSVELDPSVDLDEDAGFRLDPGRVDPFDALAALETDMAELRRRAAGPAED